MNVYPTPFTTHSHVHSQHFFLSLYKTLRNEDVIINQPQWVLHMKYTREMKKISTVGEATLERCSGTVSQGMSSRQACACVEVLGDRMVSELQEVKEGPSD